MILRLARPKPDPKKRLRTRAICAGRDGHIGKPWATYPANLCLFLSGVEFSDAGKDLGEAVHQMAEEATVFALGKVATEHFHDMLSGLEGMEHARQGGLGARRGN